MYTVFVPQAQWDGLTGRIVLNKIDGLRKEFNLDLISLKEDGTAKVSQLSWTPMRDVQLYYFCSSRNDWKP